MAAPSNTTWGSTRGNYGRIGIALTVTENSDNKTVEVHIQVWFWSKYSVSDTSNTLYYNNGSSSATTSLGSVSINTTVDSGGGWSTSNQVKLKEYTYTYDRGTSVQSRSVAARLVGIDRVGASLEMTATRTYTIPALDSYTVTYNANGGSGAPSKQTKYHGKSLTLSSAKPIRSGYAFQGWGTSSTDSTVDYSAGATYTRDASITLYAIWKANTYTVTYNANGGSGAPSNQTKTHGTNLTLSSTIPTKAGYTFKGWGTSASSTTVAYAPGATYSANAAITLYAIWKFAFTAPRIDGVSVDRSDSDGTLNDEGTYVLVSFGWSCETEVESIRVQRKLETASSWTTTTITASGTSGTVSRVIYLGTNTQENSYDIRITVTDQNNPTVVEQKLPAVKFEMDFLSGGNGVAIGKPATDGGYFDVNYILKTRVGRCVHHASGTAGTLNYVQIARFYINDEYQNIPITLRIAQRYRVRPAMVYILFNNVNGKDPNLDTFYVEGDSDYQVYLAKTDTSTWSLYVRKSDAYDDIVVLDYMTHPDYMTLDIAWLNDGVSSLPSGYIQAKNFGSVTLWSGQMWPSATQTAILSEPVSDQAHGIVLVFSLYENSAPTMTHFRCEYVPKNLVAENPGGLYVFFMAKNSSMYRKVVYINDTTITGHSSNNTNFTFVGQSVNNNEFCLVRVIGV